MDALNDDSPDGPASQARKRGLREVQRVVARTLQNRMEGLNERAGGSQRVCVDSTRVMSMC